MPGNGKHGFSTSLATSGTQVLENSKHKIKLLIEQNILKYSFGLFFIYLWGVFMQGRGSVRGVSTKNGFLSAWQWQAELLLPRSGKELCIFLQDLFHNSILCHWGWLGSRAGYAPSANAEDLCRKAVQDGRPPRQLSSSAVDLLARLRQSDTLALLFIALLILRAAVAAH